MRPEDLANLFESKTVMTPPRRLVWPPFGVGHIPFAMWAIETWHPYRFVELGPVSGNSYCAALQASLALDTPFEAFAVSLWSNDEEAGCNEPNILPRLSAYIDQEYPQRAAVMQMTLYQALHHFSDGSIDLLHIGDVHDYDTLLQNYEAWIPKLSSRGVVLVQGISARDGSFGACRLWEELSARHPCFSFEHAGGLGIVYPGTDAPPRTLNWLLHEVGPEARRTDGVRQFFARLGDGLVDKLSSEHHAQRAIKAEAEGRDLTVRNEQLAAVVLSCGGELADLSRKLLACERKLTELSEDISAREEQVAGLQSQVTQRDSWIALLCHRPDLQFDADWYLDTYPDIRDAGIDPLTHYIAFGAAEGRLPCPPPQVEQAPKYAAWVEANRLHDTDVAELRQALAERDGHLPKISIITPVYNTDPRLFEEMVQSVTSQIYQDWELCLVDDCSPAAHVEPMLAEAAAKDPRIRMMRLPLNGGISAATNAGVQMASGEVVAFLDHDDVITPDCLAEIALYFADHADADLVYSDDDKIDMEGTPYAPQFKPDWSPVLLLSFMYMAHILSVRRSLFLDLGGFRTPFDGAQDFDFVLRAAEHARHIGHIPKVLYHWRAAPGSTATSADAKPESFEAGRRAVEEALVRRGLSDARAVHPEWAALGRCGMYEVEFPDTGPSVTIVIPTHNQAALLRTCVESLHATSYQNYEILIVDNDSNDPDCLAYLKDLRDHHDVRVAKISSVNGTFSYANLNNQAVLNHCDSDFVLLLNNDTKVISPKWLSQMVGYARMPDVGAVGARLYFEDGTIQHAGIVHGYHGGLVGHAFRNAQPHDWGYMGFIRASREYSGVTAACMLTPRAVFEALGGLDEVNFAVAYNDVDYCYRLVQSGRSCIYCSTAELFHFEGRTRGFVDNPQEQVSFRRLYGNWVDRWYNPNLSLENERFEPAVTRTESRRHRPAPSPAPQAMALPERQS